MSKTENKWRVNSGFYGANHILDADGFYISFNANPGGPFPMFDGDTEEGETALCIRADGGSNLDTRFLILNGDFRDDYEKLVPQGLDACIAFYESKKSDHGSSWTTRSSA